MLITPSPAGATWRYSTVLDERTVGCRYAKAVQEQVGSPDVYIPPPPALTRYKKDLAAKAEASETSPKVTPK